MKLISYYTPLAESTVDQPGNPYSWYLFLGRRPENETLVLLICSDLSEDFSDIAPNILCLTRIPHLVLTVSKQEPDSCSCPDDDELRPIIESK